ncbi:MAG: YihY/virulence factor BrkB family protein [Ignavibacteria bacterium]|nr:YihY/virulence factor BrkB family protein [Ignavibacteria bacterium]
MKTTRHKPDISLLNRLPTWVKRTWNIVSEFVDITDRRHIFLLSAGIAFNQLLCMIPLTLLVLSIISVMVHEMHAREALRSVLIQILPANIEATSTIPSVLTELNAVYTYRTIAGWISGFALIWTASALFSSLRTGLNAIFHTPDTKFFVWYKLKDLGLTIVAALLILITTALSPLLTIVEDIGESVFGIAESVYFYGFTAQAVSLISTSVLFFVLYRVVPSGKLPWQIVVMSSLFAVGLWEGARILFSWYVNVSSTLSLFYGGYVTLASLALWFYYSAFIFLLSAELSQFIYVKRTEHHSPAA